MNTNEKGQEAKVTVKEEPATGGVLKFDQMEEKQIQIVVEQLISLTIRKKGPQGAEAKAEGAGNQALGGSARPSISQEAEPGKGSGLGRRERRRYVRKSRLPSHGSDLCDCPQGLCPVCFYLCPMCSAKKCGIKYCKTQGCLFRKTDNESDKLLSPFTHPN